VRRWFVIIASLAILLTLVRAAGFREVGDTWRSVAPRGIVISVLCYVASLVARVLSWRVLLGRDAPPAPALGPPLALGFVLGHVSPAKSGEPLTAVLVSRNFGLPLARTLSVLTAERALQLALLLLTFVPAAALCAGDLLELRGTVWTAAGLLVVLVVAGLAARPALSRLQRVAARIPRIGPGVAEYLRALDALLADRRPLAPLLALGLVFWACQYASLWAILTAGGLDVSYAAAVVVAGAAILGGTLSMLPLGTQDGISAVVLAGFGIPLAHGFALSLFHTLLSLACGLVLLLALPLVGARRR
jgi:uncharacterized protein (TIRG00374 family)